MSIHREPLRSLHNEGTSHPGMENRDITTSQDTLVALSNVVTDVLSAIKEKTFMNPDESILAQHTTELDAVETLLSGLEVACSEVEQYLASERRSLKKVDAFIESCAQQKAAIEHVRLHLPAHLPGVPAQQAGPHSTSSAAAWAGYTPATFQMPPPLLIPASPSSQGLSLPQSPTTSRTLQQTATLMKQSNEQSACVAALTAATCDAHDKRDAKRKRAPRDFVTKVELDGCSSYMLGRLTQDKVNSALEEVAGLAERNAKVMAALRGPGTTVSLQPGERERAYDLLHNISKHPDVKGRFWFTEHDLKDGTCIKRDKTGKSILQVLRHLKRLYEVRGRVQGQQEVIYVMAGA